MLKSGDVLKCTAPQRRIRILWLSHDAIDTVVIDVDSPRALPETMSVQEILDAISIGDAVLLTDVVEMTFEHEDKIELSRRRVRDRAWRLIGSLVVQVPQIFFPNFRGKKIQGVVDAARTSDEADLLGVTKKLVYHHLRRYWQRGMTLNALLPDYSKCGGPGKSRKAGEKKRGRPRRFGTSTGINVTEKIRQVFQVGFARCYATDRKKAWTLVDAYDKILADFFCEKTIDPETGKVEHVPLEEVRRAGGLPTLKQFQYWAEKDHIRLEVKRRRVGARIYDKDMRGLLGTSTAEVIGPGDRYQIDATLADVYLVSRLDRGRIIGRPVLYVVIDVYSRMIVGIYVGLEGPSWVGAMMALANTAADKVGFCKKFGVDIDPEDWPCRFLPGILLGDGGEIKSEAITTLSTNFNVTIETAAAYRADWKGIVEQRFNLLPARFGPYVPGYIQQDFRARGGHDYRLDAVLDLDEFTAIIIDILLYYNNHHEITKYDRERDVIADGVPSIPVELWEWGLHHRSGAMRSFPEELVQYNLMPRDKATITEIGIHFRSAYYTCPLAIRERWFDKARQDKRWSIEVAYDPRCLDVIYLAAKGNTLSFERCMMTDRSRGLRNVSLAEIEQQALVDGNARADRREQETMARLNLNVSLENRIQQAERKRGAATGQSNASRTKNIRPDRAMEKAARRATEVFRPGQSSSAMAQPTANVMAFPGISAPSAEPDYSLPSLDEILGDDDDS